MAKLKIFYKENEIVNSETSKIIKCKDQKFEDNLIVKFVEEEISIPTDLTGYTVTVPAGWSAFEYGVFRDFGFTLINNSNNVEIGLYSGIAIGYAYSSNMGAAFASEDYICLDSGGKDTFRAGNFDNSYSFKFSNISGTDATNHSLIQWFVSMGATFTKGGN